MKRCIDLNDEKRKESTRKGDDAGKVQFKLFNNTVYGETMENLRKRVSFDVITSRKIS